MTTLHENYNPIDNIEGDWLTKCRELMDNFTDKKISGMPVNTKTIIEKVWVTKYLDMGVIQVIKNVTHYSDFPNMVKDDQGNIYHKPDWHLTEEAARARMEEKRLKRIEDLKKELKDLENKKFSVVGNY